VIVRDGIALEILLSNNDQIKHALNEATQAACVLLHVDASITFLIQDGYFSAVSLFGCEECSAKIPADSTLFQEFGAQGQDVLRLHRNRCADQEHELILNQMELHSALAVPLLANNKKVGVLLAASRSEHTFNQNDELILHAVADKIGLLLSTDNLRYRREAEALYEISTEISQLLDLDRVLDVIVEKTCSLLNAEISYIALADEDERMIRVRVTQGARGDALHNLAHKYGEGVGGWVAENRVPLLVDNYYKDVTPQPPDAPKILATEGIISAICVPMCTRRGLVGVLYATSRQEAAFNYSQLELLQALGNQAAVAIENARLYDEQKESAEKLRNSITTHKSLLCLVLENQGLQSITDTLSELLQCPVVVENNQFQVLCWSSKGFSNINQQQVLNLQTPSTYYWQDLELIGCQNILQENHHSIRVSPHQELGGHISRVVAPIFGGKTILGYVSALEVEQPLNEQQRAAVEEASIVLALEFLKQDAARASMLHHVITAQEEERKRIARELHDETSQALTALIVSLDTMSLDLAVDPEKAAQQLSATKSIAEGMLENIHRLISDLRPSLLDDLGLMPAIAWYGEQRLKPLGISFHLEGNELDQRLSPAMEIALFRIVQEAITNIIRHAQASTVTVGLIIRENCLILKVEDDGLGFDPQILQSPDTSGKSMGLWGMQERVSTLEGEFHVQTAPGQGTRITVRVPVTQGGRANV
jgi:signal transduction histidine kinase